MEPIVVAHIDSARRINRAFTEADVALMSADLRRCLAVGACPCCEHGFAASKHLRVEVDPVDGAVVVKGSLLHPSLGGRRDIDDVESVARAMLASLNGLRMSPSEDLDIFEVLTWIQFLEAFVSVYRSVNSNPDE